MILEMANLQVKEGMEEQFELGFKTAGQYISSIEGYRGHTLKKCLEHKNKYLLLVNWDSVEAHEVGFRKSEVYLKWKALLHHYYEPFPTVEHYSTVLDNSF
ncbi:antibiotic biosynthesis monooxygenase [Flammeovirga aprica JL-4]|uniref:Antibiotic biosynthesis monooxygenase n=2 Tax=Flammeovirga aprica TaxID=29528 RepID=A0A7X9S0W9_9BACT|nr:antibiotic biosynthesis monooxygenase [Flammeovirga aprica JL-4]